MIDRDTATAGLSALGTAIGEIMEDTVGPALSRAVEGTSANRADVLVAAGRDIELLARAMSILAARAEGSVTNR